MNFLRSPRGKLLVAGALLLLLPLLSTSSLNWVSLSRWVLGAAALTAGGFVLWRRKGQGSAIEELPRLAVKSRVGLSQRCALALVEADGRSYLVAFGDGFAEIREAHSSTPFRVSPEGAP